MDKKYQKCQVYAMKHYLSGNASRWKLCFLAGYIVGGYEKGATLTFATELNLSVDQVENMARAAETYRDLNHYPVVAELRRQLSPSHFAAMGDLIRKHDLSPHEAIEQLRTAAENGTSVVQLRIFVDGEHAGEYLIDLRKKIARHHAGVQHLKEETSYLPGVQAHLLEAVNALALALGELCQPEAA